MPEIVAKKTPDPFHATAARLLLVAGLVGINSWPFFVNSRTSYETVYFSLSSIHAELCLLAAWGIFVEKEQRPQRMLWCLLGTCAAVVASIRLLTGQWLGESPWVSVSVAVASSLTCLIPMAPVFVTLHYLSGTTLVASPVTALPPRRFRLKQLFGLIAGCALLSLWLRQLIHSNAGWLEGPRELEVGSYFGTQSFITGLFAAPCALIVLQPNRYIVVWLVYFVAVAALEPLVVDFAGSLFLHPIGRVIHEWNWPEDSYLSIVIDNLTWYGPQQSPTVILFVLLKLSGVRVRNTK